MYRRSVSYIVTSYITPPIDLLVEPKCDVVTTTNDFTGLGHPIY